MVVEGPISPYIVPIRPTLTYQTSDLFAMVLPAERPLFPDRFASAQTCTWQRRGVGIIVKCLRMYLSLNTGLYMFDGGA